MVKIGAAWKQAKKDGTPFLKLKIDFPAAIILDDNTDLLLFRNKSEAENSPVYDALIAKRSKPADKPKAQSDLDNETPY